MNARFSSALIAVLLTALIARADVQDDLRASRRNAIVRAIEKVAPAVVTINVVEIQRERVGDPFFYDFWDRFGPRPMQRIREHAVQSIGSGSIFDAAGHILTNYHVLQDADAISSVTLPDGRNLEVRLVGYDERTDLAVLKAKGENLPYIPFGDSESLLVGEWVVAIGNPFGLIMRDPQPSVSVGVVSANHRRVSRDVGGGERLYQDLIQTDAAINPGNSGGPLVDVAGRAVGVNTMIFSMSGGSQGLGFAIPINRVKRVAEEIIRFGRRRNPWLGFHGQAVEDLSPYSLRELGITVSGGVLVTELLRDCPATRAGLRLGDVITEMNGVAVYQPVDVDLATWELFIDDQVTLLVDRQGERRRIVFKVKELTGQ